MPGIAEIPPLLVARVCPNCGYSLEGMHSAGICPECGRGYDQSEIVLYGWARGRHENLANAKRSRIALVMFLSMLGLLAQVPQFIFHLAWLLPCIGVAVGVNVYLLARRQNTDHPGMIQVRMNGDGCVQYDDLGGPSALRELVQSHGWLIFLVVAIGLLFGIKLKWVGPILFWIWMPLCLIGAVVFYFRCRVFRRAVRQVREGSIADWNSAFRKQTLWSQVSYFRLEATAADASRLRIYELGHFFERDAVDAEIRCMREQAEELARFLKERLWETRQGNGNV